MQDKDVASSDSALEEAYKELNTLSEANLYLLNVVITELLRLIDFNQDEVLTVLVTKRLRKLFNFLDKFSLFPVGDITTKFILLFDADAIHFISLKQRIQNILAFEPLPIEYTQYLWEIINEWLQVNSAVNGESEKITTVPNDWKWINKENGIYQFGKGKFTQSPKERRGKIFVAVIDEFERNPQEILTENIAHITGLSKKQINDEVPAISKRLSSQTGTYLGGTGKGSYNFYSISTVSLPEAGTKRVKSS